MSGDFSQYSGHDPTYPGTTPERGSTVARALGIGFGTMAALAVVVMFLMQFFDWLPETTPPVTSPNPTVRPTTHPVGSPSATAAWTGEVYSPQDRPGYEEYVARATGMYDKYLAIRDDPAQIYTYVEDSDAGRNYFKDFLIQLADRSSSTYFGYGATTTLAAEADGIVAGLDASLTRLEQTFLTGHDFDISITIQSQSGTYKSDGSNQQANRPPDTSEPLPEGSAVTAAVAMADEHDLTLVFTPAGTGDACVPLDQLSGPAPLTAYCEGDTDHIVVNTAAPDYAAMLWDPRLNAAVAHSIALYEVARSCGASAPPIAGADYEGVANAYAVLYLDADADVLASLSDDPSWAITDTTTAAAEAIADGDCS